MKALRGHNAQMVLIRLNPFIRGWSAYYRHCVSARVFNELDWHVWKLAYKWANWTHPHKGKRWIVSRYFARSTRPGATGGCSATATAAPTCSSSPGRRSPGTPWSRAGPHPTTRPWPATGQPGGDTGHPRSTRPGCGYSRNSVGAARSAATCCSTPTRSHGTPTNGNSGSRPSASRPATRRSPSTRHPGNQADPPSSVSPTPTAAPPPRRRQQWASASAALTRTPAGLA